MPPSSTNIPIVDTSVPRSLSKLRWTKALSSHHSHSPTLDHRFHPSRMSRLICHMRLSNHTSAWFKLRARPSRSESETFTKIAAFDSLYIFGPDSVTNLLPLIWYLLSNRIWIHHYESDFIRFPLFSDHGTALHTIIRLPSSSHIPFTILPMAFSTDLVQSVDRDRSIPTLAPKTVCLSERV